MEVNPVVIASHIIIYIGIIVILKKLYFDPALLLLKRREALTKGRDESGKKLIEQMQALQSKYQDGVSSLKNELEEKRRQALKKAESEAAASIDDMKTKTEKSLAANQEKLDQQLAESRSKLPDLGSHLGDNMAEAVMSAKIVRM